MSHRYAICNETFQNWPHDRVCAFVSECGYTGLEIAPFTLANHIDDLSTNELVAIRRQAEQYGLRIIGLHWLLAKTTGLQLITHDAGVREATGKYLCDLAHACGNLGGTVMIFGSPAQRNIPSGVSMADAMDSAVDVFRRVLPVLEKTNVMLCLEPLSVSETNFLNTCEQAIELAARLHHPHVKLNLDVKAMSSEPTPTPELIRRHAAETGHFHANDANRRGPGFGDTDFRPIFQALHNSNYSGWISVEVFDYSPDPETIARDSLRYMRECEAAIESR